MSLPYAFLSFLAAGATLAACGSAGSSTNDSGTSASPAPSESAGSAALPSVAPSGPSGTPNGGVEVRIHNTSGHDIWLVRDAQQTPLWLEIGSPPLALNGYGGQWCGDSSRSHNDPAFTASRVAAGEVSSARWNGAHVTREGCLRWEYVSAGKYEARVCIYDSDPSPLRMSANGLAGGPSSWFVKAPRCFPLTIALAATAAAVDVNLPAE